MAKQITVGPVILLLLGCACWGLLTHRASSSAVAATPVEAAAIASLDKVIDRSIVLLKSHTAQGLDRTNFTGWDANPLLFSILDAYTLTEDDKFLRQFSDLSEQFLAWRSDRMGLSDFAGMIKPQWFRIDRYNIFTVSPLFPYDPNSREAVMKERGWKNLNYSDINHDGLFLAPMLRFVNLVHENSLDEYRKLADQITLAAIQTVASHDADWIVIAPDKGFYTFPKGSPFFLDGVEMPVNEAAIFGTALVELYEATGDAKYLDRARAMVENWLDYVAYSSGQIVQQPYVTGAWFRGWNEANSPSVNSPTAKAHQVPEVFHKAALTVDFLVHLSKYDQSDAVRGYLSGYRNLLRAAEILPGNQIAFFPDSTDLTMPLDTYHAYNPANFRGYTEIADKASWRRMYLMSYQETQSSPPDFRLTLALLATRPEDVKAAPAIHSESVSISPYLIGQSIGPGCLYQATQDAAVSVKFRRSSPKHNRMFLSPGPYAPRGIRMEVDGPLHEGVAYLRAGDCVNWQWALTGTESHSQPNTVEENHIDLTVFTLEDDTQVLH